MSDILLLLTGAVLVNHLVLARFSAVNPAAQSVSTSAVTTVATTVVTIVVTTLSSALVYLLYHYVLQPAGVPFLLIITCVLVTAVVASAFELSARTFLPSLAMFSCAPLSTINCMVLSVALIEQIGSTTLVEAVALGFGVAAAFSLMLLLFSTMCERLNMADVPRPFRGSAITLCTVALVSLAFMGFAGLV